MKKSTLRVVNSAATWHNFQSKLKKKKKKKPEKPVFRNFRSELARPEKQKFILFL